MPDKWGEVGPPYWDDRPLAVIGAGPSLTGFDFSKFKIDGVRVLAVKEPVWDMPFSDALFALDRPWINRRADKMRELTCEIFLAPTGSRRECQQIENATYLVLDRFEGFSDDPRIVQSGGNSGFGAVNVAYLKRAKRIVLFGFDYTSTGGHYTDRYLDWQPPGHNARYFPNWGSNFTACLPQIRAAGVEIINASPKSTVTAFPKVTIVQGLEYLRGVFPGTGGHDRISRHPLESSAAA